MPTVVSDDQTIPKTDDHVNATQYIGKQATNLKQEKGILSTLEGYSRIGISDGTIQLIVLTFLKVME